MSSNSRDTGNSFIRPYDPFSELNLPNETLIEKYLEENYRGQAETFVSISSLSSDPHTQTVYQI